MLQTLTQMMQMTGHVLAQVAEKAGEAAQKTAEAAAPVAEKVAEKAAAAAPEAAEKADTVAIATKSWVSELLNSGVMGYMNEGGIFMWPILILGILAAGVIIERMRSLRMLNVDVDSLRRQVLDLLHQDRVEEAIQLCDSQQGPVPAILGAGLRKLLVLRRLGYDPGKMEEQVVKAMDDYGVHVVAALERHLPILATVASAAPMIGFLGTVQGMVTSFDDIVAKMGSTNIVMAAAAGIKVALLTTVLGLVVGIPAFVAFNYFTSVINRFVLDVQESAEELIESLVVQLSGQSKTA